VNRSSGARLFGVQITTNGGIEFGPEQTLPINGFLVFNTYRDYDVTPDNKGFVMVFRRKRRQDGRESASSRTGSRN
jgi:hypothetical protein